jgi:hypothetical protein
MPKNPLEDSDIEEFDNEEDMDNAGKNELDGADEDDTIELYFSEAVTLLDSAASKVSPGAAGSPSWFLPRVSMAALRFFSWSITSRRPCALGIALTPLLSSTSRCSAYGSADAGVVEQSSS